MKRISKDPVVRRKEIIQTAQKLFAEQGYTSTPVEAIIKSAGIAKGTFYYYFKSKHELLGAIVEQISADLQQYYTSVLETKELSVIEKLKRMLRGPEKNLLSDPEIMEIFHLPENREFQEKVSIQTIEVIAPLIAEVVIQGNREGVFKADNPLEIIQILLASSLFLLDGGLFEWVPDKQSALLQTLQALFEMAIGVGPGELDFISHTG